jgi:alpha(1,3/1,4) fucosyltransferase
MALKLAFADMWSNFDPQHNAIAAMLNFVIKGGVEVTTPEDCDTLIFGPTKFGKSNLRYLDKFRIHYTGENTRPQQAQAHFYISHDLDACNYGNITSTNYRLPVWWWNINWTNMAGLDWCRNTSCSVLPSMIDRPNEYSLVPKTKFCATVFRSRGKYRYQTLDAFARRYKPIDAFGASNTQPIVPTATTKLRTIAHYKFCMCYENSSYPGYVTEKLLHAKVAGTVPIYWGSRTFAMDFNPRCCVFFNGDYDKLIADVRKLDEDDAAYAQMQSEPLFLTKPHIDMGGWIFYDIFRRRLGLPNTAFFCY